MKPMRTCGLKGHWLEGEGFRYPTATEVFEAQRCDESPHGRTAAGLPWLRWARLDQYSGWYAIGARAPNFGPRPTFWQNVYLLAAATGNGCIDAVHAIGPAVLSIGGLGVTASSGLGQSLLGACLEANPGYFLHCMAPLIQRTGVYPERLASDPEQYAFVQMPDRQILMEASLERALRGGSDGTSWSPEAKAISRLWVEAISLMLRSDAFDRVQVEFCAEQLPALLSKDLLGDISWPKSGARDAWQWTAEQQALWAVALVLALEDSEATEQLIRMSLSNTAESALQAMWALSMRGTALSPNAHIDALTDNFRQRAAQALLHARAQFRLELEFV